MCNLSHSQMAKEEEQRIAKLQEEQRKLAAEKAAKEAAQRQQPGAGLMCCGESRKADNATPSFQWNVLGGK